MAYQQPHFFHVIASFAGTVKTEAIKNDLNTELDWMMYAPNTWIVYSTKTAHELAYKIHAHLGDKDILFVTQMERQNTQGWLQEWMWTWLNKQR